MEVQVHSVHGSLQDNDYTALLQAAEAANAELTEAQLRAAATTIEDDEPHVRLSTDLRYILINTTSGPAATLCRQFQHNWVRNVQTTSHSIFNSPWHRGNRTLDKTTQAQVRQPHFRGVILHMGV